MNKKTDAIYQMKHNCNYFDYGFGDLVDCDFDDDPGEESCNDCQKCKKECKHEWVNVGFYTFKEVCKFCDISKEEWEKNNKGKFFIEEEIL